MPALDSRQWCLQQNKKEEEEEYPKLSDNGNKQIKKECIISIGYPHFCISVSRFHQIKEAIVCFSN